MRGVLSGEGKPSVRMPVNTINYNGTPYVCPPSNKHGSGTGPLKEVCLSLLTELFHFHDSFREGKCLLSGNCKAQSSHPPWEKAVVSPPGRTTDEPHGSVFHQRVRHTRSIGLWGTHRLTHPGHPPRRTERPQVPDLVDLGLGKPFHDPPTEDGSSG